MKNNSILKHELIGLKVKVVGAENNNLVGLNGKIIDETRNMLKIESSKGYVKNLIKSQVILNINYMGREYEVNGKLFVNRPEDRIKKLRRLR